jgi:hypothetical protein
MKVEVGDLVRYVESVHLPDLVGLVVERGPYGFIVKWSDHVQQTELLDWIETIK